MAGTKKWDYNPDTFKSIDTTNDGLLNSHELNNYFAKLYPDKSTQATYENIDDFIKNADINGDGLISKGEIALYKSGQDYLDKDTFITKVNTDTTTNQTQWDDLQKEYNIYNSKNIVSKGEIMEHDLELNREALSFSSKTFNPSDNNNDGFLNHSEMKTYLENLYGTCSDKTANYIFDNLDVNKDGLVSDGEFALFKLNNESKITYAKLVDAGYSQSDANALVGKYAAEGETSFNANDVKTKDDALQGKSADNTKDDSSKPIDNTKDGISVGGIIALIGFFLILVGLIVFGILWISKDEKEEKETTTETKEIGNDADTNLQTINTQEKATMVK